MQRILFFVAVTTLVTAAGIPVFAAHRRASAAVETKPDKRDAKIIAAVRAVLDAQVAGWNRGDIEAYMDGYLRSPDIVFISGDDVTRGWQTVMERYKRNYSSREKMGTLAFTDVEIKPLNRDAVAAWGRWQLTRAGDAPHGRFTLLLRRTPQGWRIVHDHTSSAGN